MEVNERFREFSVLKNYLSVLSLEMGFGVVCGQGFCIWQYVKLKIKRVVMGKCVQIANPNDRTHLQGPFLLQEQHTMVNGTSGMARPDVTRVTFTT